ncbi:MAG: M28 family peptidase [Gemmatimonadota bacterium]|nr:M28 family peptidase [Gemmatimonadota bacterium]MDE2985383.1 M28 family peptidase [Gemmatimonadota bacterium]
MSETPSSLSEALLADVSFDLGWSLLERFAVLVRESGSADERAAAHFIVSRLEALDIPHQVYEPELYLSIPRGASVDIAGGSFSAKPPSFAASTARRGLSAPPIHVPASQAADTSTLFDSTLGTLPEEVAGKIVVTEGYAMPVAVAQLEAAGAVGQVYINPGSRVHWGICTTIWGTPGDSQRHLKPTTPVAAINRPDGDELIRAIEDGLDRITLHTDLQEGWFDCPLPVARIDGREKDFLLAHGHYDSWDIGIGDNAVGDATLLELARIFHEHSDELRRSLRVAWWPAHSTGRYGGSAWYADNFGLELSRHCVATVNIDSPGCRGATNYDEVAWMAEAGEVCRTSIHSVAGVEPGRELPPRAGDYSFNELGISSFFMLLSNIPQEERERLGFYPVGGCGGNIAWHTEADRLEVADRDNLERDLRVYITAITRFLDDEIIPLDFRETMAELNEALEGYEATVTKELGKRKFNLSPVRTAFDALAQRVSAFYEALEEGHPDPATANEVLLRLGRILVHLGYAEGPRFEHDPATPRAPLPKLARVPELEPLRESESDRFLFVMTEARRQMNKVVEGLSEASRLLDEVARETAAG